MRTLLREISRRDWPLIIIAKRVPTCSGYAPITSVRFGNVLRELYKIQLRAFGAIVTKNVRVLPGPKLRSGHNGSLFHDSLSVLSPLGGYEVGRVTNC
jgi:hypothetical protein